jgi:hypothetical protein
MSWLFKVLGNDNSSQLAVDSTFSAARATLRPMQCLNWQSVSERTGNLTTIAASGAIFSFRNIGVNPIAVRRVGVGFITTTGFTTAQELAFGLKIARSFTTSDASGTTIALTGNNCKRRTSLSTITSVDCRISAAAALTSGTKTLDTNNIGVVGGYAPAATTGVVIAPSLNNLLSSDSGDYPLVVAQNEGFNIQNLILMGAGGVGVAYCSFEFAEVVSY